MSPHASHSEALRRGRKTYAAWPVWSGSTTKDIRFQPSRWPNGFQCPACGGRADVKKNILKPHLKEQFVIPPAANAAFVAAMEDVLEVYHRPHDPDRPVVCLD